MPNLNEAELQKIIVNTQKDLQDLCHKENGVTVYPDKEAVRPLFAKLLKAHQAKKRKENLDEKQFDVKYKKICDTDWMKQMMESNSIEDLYASANMDDLSSLQDKYLAAGEIVSKQKAFENSMGALKESASAKKKRVDKILARFGPNGKISATLNGNPDGKRTYTDEAVEKYYGITLPVPESLTPEMVSIIAMGIAMDNKRFDFSKQNMGNGVGDDRIDFNRQYLYMNILGGDERTLDFSDIVAESRKVTKDALEAYQQGDLKPVQRAVTSFSEVVKNALLSPSDASTENLFLGEKQFFQILMQMERIPELKVREQFTETQWGMVQSHAAQIESADIFYQKSLDMMHKMPEAESKERKEMAFDLLLNAVTMKANSGTWKSELSQLNKEMMNAFLLELNLPVSNDDLLSEIGKKDSDLYTKLTGGLTAKLNSLEEKAKIFPMQGILSETDGKEKLRTVLKNAIEKSELYQDLVKETNPDKLIKCIEQAKETDIRTYSDVQLDDTKAQKMRNEISEQSVQLRKEKTEEWKKEIEASKAAIISIHKEAMEKKEAKFQEEKQGIAQKLGELSVKLNASTRIPFHSDSAEIIALRQQAEKLQTIMDAQTNSDALHNDPKVKRELFESYMASRRYLSAKRADAGVKETDSEWRPSTSGGKKRFEAALEIEEFAKQYLGMEEIRRMAEQDEKEIEQERLEDRKEELLNGNALKGSVIEGLIKSAKNNFEDLRKTMAVRKDCESLKEKEDNKEIRDKYQIDKRVANLIATYIVADAYERDTNKKKKSPDKSKMNEEMKAFNANKKKVIVEMLERPEFKAFMASVKLKDLIDWDAKQIMMGIAAKRAELNKEEQKNPENAKNEVQAEQQPKKAPKAIGK